MSYESYPNESVIKEKKAADKSFYIKYIFFLLQP